MAAGYCVVAWGLIWVGGCCEYDAGTVRYHLTVRYRTILYRYRTVRYGTLPDNLYGTVRYGTVRYGTVRYGIRDRITNNTT